jgi:hypothetical protein
MAKEKVNRAGSGYQNVICDRRSKEGPKPHLLAMKQSPALLSEAPGATFKTTKRKFKWQHKGCHTDTLVRPRPTPAPPLRPEFKPTLVFGSDAEEQSKANHLIVPSISARF